MTKLLKTGFVPNLQFSPKGWEGRAGNRKNMADGVDVNLENKFSP